MDDSLTVAFQLVKDKGCLVAGRSVFTADLDGIVLEKNGITMELYHAESIIYWQEYFNLRPFRSRPCMKL